MNMPPTNAITQEVFGAALFSVTDAAKTLGCSGSHVKRLARFLDISPIKTGNGYWLLNGAMVDKIATEIRRRSQEQAR